MDSTLTAINTILVTLASFDPVSLSILLSVVSIVILVLHGSRVTTRTIKVAKLHDRLFSEWLRFVDGKLLEVITIATNKARIIIAETYKVDPELCVHCATPKDHNEPKVQLSLFTNKLRDVLLYNEVKHALKDAYRLNGFYEMEDSKYRQYIADKSSSLLSLTIDSIHDNIHEYSYLTGRQSDMFSKSEVFEIVNSLFNKAKEVKDELIKQEKQIVSETSLLPTAIASKLSMFYKSSV